MLDKNEEHSILVSSIMFCCLYVACVKQMVKTGMRVPCDLGVKYWAINVLERLGTLMRLV